MNQLIKIWSALSRGQRISLVVVPLLVLAAVLGLSKWRHESDFRVLYSSLAPEDASAVTRKIREAGIEFRLDETGATVLVPSEHLADSRLALAGAGLPRTGRIGFELFDRNNLGASDFAEQVNYRRALEGELERTVATLSEVDQARIHITFAKDSVFLDTRQPSKATVVLRLKRSAQLPQSSVSAVANLVASAVEGLGPESVAIIDSSGRLLNRPRPMGDSDAQLAETNLDYQHQKESELLTKINLALGPLLGPERFRASVNVDCDFSSSEQNDEIIDPDRSAMITSQTTEESGGGSAAGGTPGTASNLPHPTARSSTGGAGGVVRRTENVSYQPSRTVKRTVSPKGSIRRISTAILVDQPYRWEGTGAKAKKIVTPPTAQTLKGVHDIVAGITGFTETRGDQITIETLPFESTVEAEPPLPPSAPARQGPAKFDFKQPVVMGAAVLIVLLLAALAFVLMRRGAPKITATTAQAIATGEQTKGAPQVTGSTTGSMGERVGQQIADNEARQAQLESEALNRIRLPDNSKKTDVLVKHIRESVTKDPVNVTNVLRTWISDLDTKRTH